MIRIDYLGAALAGAFLRLFLHWYWVFTQLPGRTRRRYQRPAVYWLTIGIAAASTAVGFALAHVAPSAASRIGIAVGCLGGYAPLDALRLVLRDPGVRQGPDEDAEIPRPVTMGEFLHLRG